MSEEPKYCANCFHARGVFTSQPQLATCNAPENYSDIISLVTGKPTMRYNTCEAARIEVYGDIQFSCGLAANWYKPLPTREDMLEAKRKLEAHQQLTRSLKGVTEDDI